MDVIEKHHKVAGLKQFLRSILLTAINLNANYRCGGKTNLVISALKMKKGK